VPTVKNAQQKVNSHVLMSFRTSRISLQLKFASLDRGEFLGKRASMNAFSSAVSHFACGGTGAGLLASRI
jgi:hypothetical protein